VSEVAISIKYENVEICCVDVKFGSDRLRVIVYYHPPRYTAADEQYIDLSLRCFSGLLSGVASQAILMGDFNFPKTDWIQYTAPANSFYDKFMTFVNENGLDSFNLCYNQHGGKTYWI